ncbi:unnamed protein product [Hyaloperonospora brassicae]|uniref:dCMP deaminase n=1 Tax=Hyaloperonospora brassicae TaxID=162125 RepID=A0AAV0V2D1_HYABA|nr:unnamed protein product [Hyaloperonospora brassicae]
MTRAKLSGRQIMQLFYTEVHRSQSVRSNANDAEVSTVFQCKCGKMRSQKLKHGYTNLVQHVLMKHADWVTAAVRDVCPSPVPAPESSAKSPSSVKKKCARTPRAPTEDKTTLCGDEGTLCDVPSGAKLDDVAVKETAVAVLQPSIPLQVQKRLHYLSWDDYFMSVAFLSAMRSKDPSTQVGACIVNPERKIVGIGYNGFPNGCGDDELPWARESETNLPLDTKYPYVCHAEMNAILNKNSTDVKGCTMYVALFPCNECAKLIIQSGIARVVYCSDKYKQDWKFVASRRLLDMAGVQYVQHQLQQSRVVIDFSLV